MNDANRKNEAPRVGMYRPTLTLYHASTKGTGSAMSMTLHPAHDDVGGCIMVKMASQMTVGDLRSASPRYPTFDWDSGIVVKLDFDDLSKMLQVFRGECEAVEEGKGLLHVTAQHSTSIDFRHMVDPICGYSLEFFRTSRDGKSESRARFILSPCEALGVSTAIESSLGVIAFGIPMLIPHDTAQYRREAREARNAAAA